MHLRGEAVGVSGEWRDGRSTMKERYVECCEWRTVVVRHIWVGMKVATATVHVDRVGVEKQ